MGKAVLISVRPEWTEKILRGEKTLDVRKTRPKLETPFRVYIYCTAGNLSYEVNNGMFCNISGGKLVVGEFMCDWIIPVVPAPEPYGSYDVDDDFVVQTGLVNGGLWDYGNGATLYGWHVTDLRIYDTPRKLSEFWFPPELYCEKELCGGCPWDQSPDVDGEYEFDCEWRRPLRRPPQSWCYVEELTKSRLKK